MNILKQCISHYLEANCNITTNHNIFSQSYLQKLDDLMNIMALMQVILPTCLFLLVLLQLTVSLTPNIYRSL